MKRMVKLLIFSWAMFCVFVIAGASEVEWTRFIGRVKAINLKAQTVTIQDRDGNLYTIPVDYQVKMLNKEHELLTLKNLDIDQKITLIRVPAEAPRDDSEGLVPFGGVPEPETQRRNKK